MAATARAYLLTLPSGAVVRARKASPTILLGREAYVLPLLTVAMQKAAVEAPADDEADPERPAAPPAEGATLRAVIERICMACLLSPRCPEDLPFADIPPGDAMALYQWAVGYTPDALMDARADGRTAWQVEDLQCIVEGNGAALVDMVARRYRTLPSRVLGLDRSPWRFDFDAAVAYRSIRAENKAVDDARAERGEGGGYARGGEVEVEDMFGGTHRVPREWLADSQIEPGARVTDAESLARGGGQPVLRAGGTGEWDRDQIH